MQVIGSLGSGNLTSATAMYQIFSRNVRESGEHVGEAGNLDGHDDQKPKHDSVDKLRFGEKKAPMITETWEGMPGQMTALREGKDQSLDG